MKPKNIVSVYLELIKNRSNKIKNFKRGRKKMDERFCTKCREKLNMGDLIYWGNCHKCNTPCERITLNELKKTGESAKTIYELCPSVNPKRLEYLFLFLDIFNSITIPEKYREATAAIHSAYCVANKETEDILRLAIQNMEDDLNLPKMYFTELEEKWLFNHDKREEVRNFCKSVFQKA